jgi:hypothetical protein
MRRLIDRIVLLSLLAGASACHPGPVIGGGPRKSVGGTIAGIVSATAGSVALPGRKVTAIEVATNARYDTTTAANGGYTIQVPEGTYRLEVELRAGETLEKRPPDTRVDNGDLDAARDFVITVKP